MNSFIILLLGDLVRFEWKVVVVILIISKVPSIILRMDKSQYCSSTNENRKAYVA